MYEAANVVCHCVYHDRVSVRERGWNRNVSCFKHKINSDSEAVNMFVGLGEFFEHYVQSWNKISWNSFIILVLEWDQQLPLKQMPVT